MFTLIIQTSKRIGDSLLALNLLGIGCRIPIMAHPYLIVASDSQYLRMNLQSVSFLFLWQSFLEIVMITATMFPSVPWKPFTICEHICSKAQTLGGKKTQKKVSLQFHKPVFWAATGSKTPQMSGRDNCNEIIRYLPKIWLKECGIKSVKGRLRC